VVVADEGMLTGPDRTAPIFVIIVPEIVPERRRTASSGVQRSSLRTAENPRDRWIHGGFDASGVRLGKLALYQLSYRRTVSILRACGYIGVHRERHGRDAV